MSKSYSGLFTGTSGALFAAPGEVVFKSYALDSSNLKDYTYFTYISRRNDIDVQGVYDVVAHGLQNQIQIEYNGKNIFIDSRTLARLIKADSKYKAKQPIRLLSCNTGYDNNSIAQHLANKLNAIVYAPNNILWAYPNGKYIIAPRLSNDPLSPQYVHPNTNKQYSGKFIPFYPGGNIL